MAAQTIVRVTPAPSALPEPSGRAGFRGALASEWTKMRSLRSTLWTLGVVALLVIGLGALINWANANHTLLTSAHLAAMDLTKKTLNGIILGQLAMITLGVLAVTSEYSTGMIRTSLTVQPRRMNVFGAKLLVIAAIGLVIGEITSFASFLISSQFWHAKGIYLTLSGHNVLQAVIGGGLYMAGTAILGFGLGALLRHTAGAIVTGVFLVFVLSLLSNALPATWQSHIDKWLPMNAGGQVWATQHIAGVDLGAWTGFLVFMIYGLVAVLLGAYRFKRADA